MEANSEGLSAAILAGGHSTRMGQDKALLSFGGKALIQHILERVSPIAKQTFVVTNQPEGYAFLEIPLVGDIIPEAGPLGGVYTALCRATQPYTAIVACDVPFVNPGILTACYNRLRETGKDAAIPHSGDKPEPLQAVYRRQTCLAVVKRALDAGQYRMTDWLSEVEVSVLTWREMEIFDAEHAAFININTPDDFKRAEQLSFSLGRG